MIDSTKKIIYYTISIIHSFFNNHNVCFFYFVTTFHIWLHLVELKHTDRDRERTGKPVSVDLSLPSFLPVTFGATTVSPSRTVGSVRLY